jgi:hypothetical protein
MTRCSSIALLLALAFAGPARADDAAEAKVHYREAVRLYRAQKYREAIGEFENAYRKKPHGNIQFNLAQCREKLGEWPAALRGYHDYLREVPDATDRATVAAYIRRLEGKLAETGVQVLLIYSDPLGAEVRLDGKVRGATPFHIVLAPGEYDLTLVRSGYVTVAREVTLAQRGSQVVDEKLVPAAAVPLPPPPIGSAPQTIVPPPAAPDLSARPPAQAPATAAKLPAPPPPRPAAPAARPRLWTWVSAGVTAAALGGAIAFGRQAQSRSDELTDGALRTGAQNQELANQAKSSAKKANILYGVAGAAGAASLTLFFVEGRF